MEPDFRDWICTKLSVTKHIYDLAIVGVSFHLWWSQFVKCVPHFVYSRSVDTLRHSRISYVVSDEIKAFNVTDNSYKSIKTASSPTAMFAAGVMRMPSASSLAAGRREGPEWLDWHEPACPLGVFLLDLYLDC